MAFNRRDPTTNLNLIRDAFAPKPLFAAMYCATQHKRAARRWCALFCELCLHNNLALQLLSPQANCHTMHAMETPPACSKGAGSKPNDDNPVVEKTTRPKLRTSAMHVMCRCAHGPRPTRHQTMCTTSIRA